uniref:Uncharacterized protein n=1 Tax=Panagrolaimus sp. ES5 TaxID=591445 RepID=A0AC34FQU2_9BILA
MMKHFESMQHEYFRLKQKNKDYELQNIRIPPYPTNCLDEFGDIAAGICKYTSMSTIATMDYSRDGHGQSNTTNTPAVVSAIEFDKDGEYFVIAGIAHKMKLYDFDSVMDKPQAATPIAILPTTIKVSNVCWNPFSKPILATSYYNGSVQVWDCHASRILHTYTEHEKRCWSIQFNSMNENLMASGSDDQKVKIWSLVQGNSVHTIDTKVLVCCVHFNPATETQLAFGGSGKSTDSTLRVWNIREDEAENVLEGHLNEKNFVGLATNGEHIVCGSESNEVYTYYKKCQRNVCKYDFAQDITDDWSGIQVPRMCNSVHTIDTKVLVCCVHFNPATETQLAFGGSGKSTDSTLRVWNIREDEAENVLEGHLNEKNFVGLATNGEHIVCGSESNEVYTYYKKCQRNVCKYDFAQDITDDWSGIQVPRMCTTDSSSDFVSALCWKKESNIVMAANSQGKAQILQLSP